jgi:hypothetical protein
VELTKQQKDQYRRRYLDLVKKCGVVKEGEIDNSKLWNESASLIKEIMKHPKMEAVIKSTEIYLIIITNFFHIRQRYKDIANFTFIEKISPNELEDEAEKFVNLLGGLPYKHYFYVRLPIHLPENLHRIKLTEQFELLNQCKLKGKCLFFQSTLGCLKPYWVTRHLKWRSMKFS